MKKWNLSILIGLVIIITGCSNIPLTTMYKMISLNPLNVDPQQLVVAVRMPKGIKIREGDVVLSFAFQAKQPNMNFNHKFLVQVNPDYQIPAMLNEKIRDHDHITVLKLSKQDALTMSQAQKMVKDYRVNNNDGGGSFNLNIVTACREEGLSLKNSELDMYLKLKGQEDFFTFLDGVEIAELEDIVENDIPYCT